MIKYGDMIKKYVLFTMLVLGACKEKKSGDNYGPGGSNTPDTVDVTLPNGDIVHGQAIITIGTEQQLGILKMLSLIPSAYAATATATVTYVNAPATTFTINATSLVAGVLTGDTLDLGSIVISALTDNKLKDCGPLNDQKCNNAYIRIYTTGSVAGFVHADGYGVPLQVGYNSTPVTNVDLGSANAATLQTYAIPNTVNRVRLSHFPTPTYNFNSDFSNAGAGNYSATIIIQYALIL